MLLSRQEQMILKSWKNNYMHSPQKSQRGKGNGMIRAQQFTESSPMAWKERGEHKNLKYTTLKEQVNMTQVKQIRIKNLKERHKWKKIQE